MAHVPALLEKVITMPWFREYGRTFDLSGLNTRSVDATKVTDHHALIVTGVVPEGLSEAEAVVYEMIAGRMLEAFSPRCEKESLKMECVCEGMDFRSQSAVIVNPGWRAVFSRKEDRERTSRKVTGNGGVCRRRGNPGHGIRAGTEKTLPRPFTRKRPCSPPWRTAVKIADGQAREAVKELGIGTPATRAAIITTLSSVTISSVPARASARRKGALPLRVGQGHDGGRCRTDRYMGEGTGTDRGHTLDPESFMLSIREYTGKVTGEILRLKFPEPSSRAFTCPKCKTGNVIVKAKVAKCDHEGCGLLVFRRFLNKELTDQHLEQLSLPAPPG